MSWHVNQNVIRWFEEIVQRRVYYPYQHRLSRNFECWSLPAGHI